MKRSDGWWSCALYTLSSRLLSTWLPKLVGPRALSVSLFLHSWPPFSPQFYSCFTRWLWHSFQDCFASCAMPAWFAGLPKLVGIQLEIEHKWQDETKANWAGGSWYWCSVSDMNVDCRHFSRWSEMVPPGGESENVVNSVSRILALSSHSVVRIQARHPTFCPQYDFLDHTNQIFSERFWHPLSTDPPTTHPSPFLTHQTHQTQPVSNSGWWRYVPTQYSYTDIHRNTWVR